MIEIRLASDSDKPQILERMAEVYGEGPARDAERLWSWRWHQDPRLAAPGIRGLVAEWRGQIIGNLSTIPAGLHIQGRPVTAWWMTDVLVHWGLMRKALRDHRRHASAGAPDFSRGIAAAMMDHPSAGPIQLGKHLSDNIRAIVQRIGYVPQPDTGSMRRRITLRHPIDKALGPILGAPVTAVADLALPRIPGQRLPVAPLDAPFDERFDALWRRTIDRFPAICRRDGLVLEWRYRQHPDGDYRALILEGDDGLRGYVVVKAFDRGRRRRGLIVDLLTDPGDQDAMSSLLDGALAELRRLKAERADIFASGTQVLAQLARLGFKPRSAEDGRDHSLVARWLPEAAHGLYCTQGDGDGG